jgi:hypothetical protein
MFQYKKNVSKFIKYINYYASIQSRHNDNKGNDIF